MIKEILTGTIVYFLQTNTIVINKHKPLDQRLHVLAKCFSQINLENVYIKPVLRDLIEQAKTDKVYE
jgi:hypothetical protein